MESAQRAFTPRPVRVAIPVLVSFSSDAFAVKDYVLNLSEGGIFLPTEKNCAVGARGRLTFRVSQFDDPFVLEAEVVRTVEPEAETNGQQAGLGMRFLEVGDADLERLRRLVDGVCNGSVVDAIRRGIRDSGKTLDHELHMRPVDQKMMLALNATNQEINALLRDGNPAVLTRLLECPRLTSVHVSRMLRMPNLPPRVLSAIRKARKWLASDEARWLFCTHPATPLSEAVAELRFLSAAKQRDMARNMKVRQPIRVKAAEMTNPRNRSR